MIAIFGHCEKEYFSNSICNIKIFEKRDSINICIDPAFVFCILVLGHLESS